MKSKKGITIISLIIYIIVLSVVIGTTSILIKYFYHNTEETVMSKKTVDQYSRFVAYIADDVNSRKSNLYRSNSRNRLRRKKICANSFYFK